MLARSHRQGLTATGRDPLDARGDDLYQTPECATRALLRAERLPHFILEPACGPGAIVRVLRAAGRKVLASDLVDYGCEGQLAGVDFLMEWQMPQGIECICTNPPFKLATQFVRHALALNVPVVAMLLRLAFLEGSSRSDILDGGQLARVWVFKNRLPRMHRDGWDGNKASSSIAFAWFVWLRGWGKPPELHRISWS